jgi:hypothetical protein
LAAVARGAEAGAAGRSAAGAGVVGAACTPIDIAIAATAAQIHALMPEILLVPSLDDDRRQMTTCP